MSTGHRLVRNGGTETEFALNLEFRSRSSTLHSCAEFQKKETDWFGMEDAAVHCGGNMADQQEAAPLKDKTILVVADDAESRDLLRVLLEKAGATVVATESVDAAFETYRQTPPHAVVSDIRLGVSDGYALIKEIRETDLEYRGSTVVVAVTESASPEEQKRAFAAGFDAYIAKPFHPDEIVETLRELLSHRRA
jgi:two-component system, OmpR family, response regulator